MDGVTLVGAPDLPVIAWRAPGLPIQRVAEAMTAKGWFVRPMARPQAIHMGMITLHQGPVVEAYTADVAEVIAALHQTERAEGGQE